MTISLEARARLALDCLVDLRRTEEFLGLLHPDVQWTIPGSWPGISGTKGYEEIAFFMRKVFPAGFPGGIDARIGHVHATGTSVVIEFTGVARTSKGRTYENAYCFVFQFEDDRVLRIREYMDTLYAHGVLHADPPQQQ